ncbi:uncharacterized protein [Nicotiana sylvestris]|uniref:uncharacterized protein n=1 Tax=Nicotiana sylvestris TaxID=4096 RepID=UPI00388C6891
MAKVAESKEETGMQDSVKLLRTNKGGEFFSNEFRALMSDSGIKHQSTCAYTPHQNGVAERKHKTILNMARQAPGVSPLPPESPTIQTHHLESPATTLHIEFLAHSTEAHKIDTKQLSTTQTSLVAPYSPEFRRSSRPSRPPLWLQDYVTKGSKQHFSYPLSSYVSYNRLKPAYMHALSVFLAVSESIVDLPPGKVPIGCKWIFNVKYMASGEVERIVDALPRAKHWLIYQMDVHNSFLNGDLLEEVYMQMGFQQSHFDYSLLTKKAASDLVVILGEKSHVGTPLELNQKLTYEEYDKHIGSDKDCVD